MEELKWGYRRDDCSESASGPFASREEALEAARGCYTEGTVLLGRCKYFHLENYVHLGALDIVDAADERAYEEAGLVDEIIFDLKDVQGAQQELDEFLVRWAEKWAETSWHWVLVEEEEVAL